jgi:hypothetical protein
MVRGGCLCGAIRFEADSVPLISNCHCSKCRKAVGSAFRATAWVPLAQFRFLRGEDHMFVGSKAPWWTITDAAPQFEEWVPGFGPDGDR